MLLPPPSSLGFPPGETDRQPQSFFSSNPVASSSRFEEECLACSVASIHTCSVHAHTPTKLFHENKLWFVQRRPPVLVPLPTPKKNIRRDRTPPCVDALVHRRSSGQMTLYVCACALSTKRHGTFNCITSSRYFVLCTSYDTRVDEMDPTIS